MDNEPPKITETGRSYSLNISITKVNGFPPAANLDLSNATRLDLEGNAYGKVTITYNNESEETEDVTSEMELSVSFGNSRTDSTARKLSLASSDGNRTWSFSGDMPLDKASHNDQLLWITAIAEYPDTRARVRVDYLPIAVDKLVPAIAVTKPLPDQTFELSGGTLTIPLEVIASDNRGLQGLTWTLDGTPMGALSLNAVTGRWQTDVVVDQVKTHTLSVEATDVFSLKSSASLTVDVVAPYTPADPEYVTGAVSYLGNLLSFAASRIDSGNANGDDKLPSADDFSRIFCQRYSVLVNPANRSIATRYVRQTRIAIEVLRDYIATRGVAGSTTANAAYLGRAYGVLLNQLGTSVTEIRLAASAPAGVRIALAGRLGIGADALQNFVVADDQLTETALENLFGLADTTALNDPFASTAIPPLYLRKHQGYLRYQWRQQDDNVRIAPFAATPVPIVDPDLLSAGDLKSQTVKDWFTARKSQLDQIENSLRQLTGSGAALFEAAIETGLGAGKFEQFKTLVADYGQGHDIGEALKNLFLDSPAFLFLLNQYAVLTGGNTPLPAEWDGIFSVLVQTRKLRDLYGNWRQEEVNAALALGPDDFVIPEPAGESKPLPAWRASVARRQDWEHRLKARIDADAAAREQLIAAVDVAEASVLPLLRDQLINVVAQAAHLDADADVAERLTQELFIDFKAGGQQTLPRIDQGLETLQSVLAALRRERLANITPAVGASQTGGWKLQVDLEAFDLEWQWMSDFAAWQSAMNVFLFPENFLQADHRPLQPAARGQTDSFRFKLVEPLNDKSRVTGTTAKTLAADYLSALKNEVAEAKQQLGDAFTLQAPASVNAVTALRNTISAVLHDTVPTDDTAPTATHFWDAPAWVQEVFYFVPMLLAQHLTRSKDYRTALDWYQAVYAYNLPGNPKVYLGLVWEENDPVDFALTNDWLTGDFNPHKFAETRGNVYTRHTIAALSECLLAWADDLFSQETPQSMAQARVSYLDVLALLNSPVISVPPQLSGKPLTNALLQALRQRAEVNLQKLRGGLNIAGMERVNAAPGSAMVMRQPTPYRYQVLIERAKQLTSTAEQVESAFLSTLEKYFAESYTLEQASQGLDIAQKQQELQQKRQTEVGDTASVVQLQKGRSDLQVEHYQDLLKSGLTANETDQLHALEHTSDWGLFGQIASVASTALAVASPMVSAGLTGGMSALWSYLPTALGNGANIGSVISGGLNIKSSAEKSNAEVTGLRASFERREQEWRRQLALAQKDQEIGNAQIKVSSDQVAVVDQEYAIAKAQAEHAMHMVQFLSKKFTNAELYKWMAQVLQRAYGYFLQQATATARLAETQLIFERQQAMPAFIQADYWQAPNDGSANQPSDQRGMTGSVRLLQDITELDQYAFLSNSRKLQMSKTFSLAALSPIEFQRFRDTGVIRFNTAMALFDRDFPGHYLRLIRQARTSVVALVPPTVGIHATLTNFGVSRVVVDDGGFRQVEVHHGMQSVALTGAVNATGVFELIQQPEFLMPFESVGVDTFWELRMPKAANPFDFTTIGDVLVTLDYTALDSWQYRKQVIQSLPTDFGADRSFGLRDQFPDLWYDLNHADQAATPNIVQWDIAKGDFPANALDVSISQLVLYFVGKDGLVLPELPIKFLGLDNGNAESVGGAATAVAGIASSRRGNAASWLALQGKSPVGRWHLDLSDRLADGRLVSQLIADESIADILFVVSYSARYPAWPA